MKINVVLETPKLLDWIEARVLPVVLSARIRSLTGKVPSILLENVRS